MRAIVVVIAACSILVTASCSSAVRDTAQNTQPLASLSTLPQDSLQPGERTDSLGRVMPLTARHSSVLPVSSPFASGAESFAASTDVTNAGGAASFTAPAGGVSYAIYRFALGGQQPSTVAIDANVHLVGGQTSAYWVGVSDYAAGVWEWHGPYKDSQIAFTVTQGGDYLSSLGNTFIAVAGYDGAQLDIVGVMVAPQSGDATPPPAVSAAPQLTPIAGGLEVQWLPVVAGDLAGYRIYYSYSPFTTATGNGVQSIAWLENTERMILPIVQNRITWVGVTAVDRDGNESALSPVASAARASAGTMLPLDITVSATSTEFGDSVTLSYSGADSFDLDLDGDGNFEISGAPAGSQSVQASAIGILRPRVRGTSGDGTAVAFGSVSLIVPAQAVLDATPAAARFGTPVYLHLDLPGAATDIQWDLDGDGTFEVDTGSDPDTTTAFNTPGYLTVSAHATYQGMVLTASKPVLVQGWRQTLADSGPDHEGSLPSMAMINGKPAIAYYWTDASSANPRLFYVRASDPEGTSWGTPVDVAQGGFFADLQLINGFPAISYYDGVPNLYFVRATNAAGSAWDAPVPVDLTTTVDQRTSLVQLEGIPSVPAIAYEHRPTKVLHFVRANDSAGSSWDLPQQPDTAIVQTGLGTSMAIVAGNPAIGHLAWNTTDGGYTGRYVRAADADGLTWAAPATVVLSGPGYGAQGSAELAVVNGRPALAMHQYMLTASDPVYSLQYLIAKDSVGSAWEYRIPVSGNSPLQNLQMTTVGGYATATYTSVSQTFIVRAIDLDGDAWDVPMGVCRFGVTGLADVSGAPGVTGGYVPVTGGTQDLAFSRLY